MNTSIRFCRQLFSGLAITGCLVATAFAQEDDIVGNWECGLSVDDPENGMSVRATFEMTYDDDGAYSRDGQLNVSIAALQLDLSVVMNETGTWRLVDSTGLAETATDVTFSSASETPNQMEQMMVQTMQDESAGQLSQEQTTQIRSLTATTMELEDDEGTPITCEKV